MNASNKHTGAPYRRGQAPAFALVVTMLMMSMVVVLALALLALASGAGGAARAARQLAQSQANAQLSVAMAMGQLQKLAGPDRRVTATAGIKDAKGQPYLTGVWEAARLDSARPSVPDKDGVFRGWLGSDPQPGRLADPNYAAQSPPDADSVAMVGRGTLGPAASANLEVRAPTVPAGTATGASAQGRPRLAWSVLDEGVKARLDLVEPTAKDAPANGQAVLGAAPRYALESVTGLGSGFEWWKDQNVRKLSGLPDVPLLVPGAQSGALVHDVTAWSRGVLASTTGTGVKRDLSLMLDAKNAKADAAPGAPPQLPAPYNKQMYTEAAVAGATSNPNWTQAAAYAQLYGKVEKSTLGDYQVRASTPTDYDPAQLLPPNGEPLVPAVAKVQMVFSLVSRMSHGQWPVTLQTNKGGPPNDGDAYWKMLHMIYSPIVTLYNPYNISLSFNKLQVEFVDVPIGFRFYVNGVAQTANMAPLNQFYTSRESSIQSKIFSVTLQNSLTSSNAPVVLAPGETRIFGAFLPETWRWIDESPGTGTDGNKFFDWRDAGQGGTASTVGFTCAPGWVPGIGFDVDWLAPSGAGRANGFTHGVIPVKRTDQVDVEFAPLQPSVATSGMFATRVSVIDSTNKVRAAGRMELAYESTSTLRKSLGEVETAGFGKVAFPARMGSIMKQAGGWPVLCWEIYEDANTMVKDYAKGNPFGGKGAKPFTVFTFSGKTTVDAGFPTRPWVVSNPACSNVRMDLKKEHQGIHPYEFVMQPVGSGGAGVAGSVELDELDRGYYFTSHSAMLGLQTAPHYELPVLPLQSVAQLRHANLAGSGQLPATDYTVGESFAHPLIPSGALRANAPSGSYQMLDHTWLLNNLLWDNFYFSTLNSYEGLAFGGGSQRALQNVVSQFLDGSRALLNTRYSPYLPAGRDPASIATELEGREGFRRAAAYMVAEGAFNINSTSVEAWKALLGGLSHHDVAYFDGMDKQAGLVRDALNLFSRFRRPGGRSVDGGSGGSPGLPWRGCRTLKDQQIDLLAREIVKEVKRRGPFLSLAEFVNRRPGNDNDLALRGALQAAIDRSGVNDIFQDATQAREVAPGDITAYGFAFPQAATGWNAVAAPGYLTQGDILTAVGPYVAARSDTFRVRGYGDVRDNSGNVTSRAWCEAMVQRIPDYVLADLTEDDSPTNGNSAFEPQVRENGADNPGCAPINQTFGRRFRVINFRWLTPDEV